MQHTLECRRTLSDNREVLLSSAFGCAKNDDDGKKDYPQDPGCSSRDDPAEKQ